MNILITGGCGFIGTNYISKLIQKKTYNILNIDKLNYASNLKAVKLFQKEKNFKFIKSDINNSKVLNSIFDKFNPDYLINFAAESHVDNSISSPYKFLKSNFIGTFALLEQTRIYLQKNPKKKFKFHQVSTDEVYGDMDKIKFNENSHYRPSSPYSASKASADHLVRSWQRTYGIPIIITCCSNNYGPYQHHEKFIPTIIKKALKGEPIPIYGDGNQIRDWIYVEDHVEALIKCINRANIGETYNIGSNNQITNIKLAKKICQYLDIIKPLPMKESYCNLISYVSDRPGHDRRYGINNSKICKNFKWNPKYSLDTGIELTVNWYLNNT